MIILPLSGARLVIDTRNATHAMQEHREKIGRC
jgi:hypothetical protein